MKISDIVVNDTESKNIKTLHSLTTKILQMDVNDFVVFSYNKNNSFKKIKNILLKCYSDHGVIYELSYVTNTFKITRVY